MSLARGKYGIEYNPKPVDEGSHGLGWVFAVVAAVALVSLVWSLVNRFRSPEPSAPEPVQPVETRVPEPEPEPAPAEPAPVPEEVREVQEKISGETTRRPPAVSQLLMRLEEAEKRRDLEMAVNAIETLRSLPGSPAADIDDSLARRLGAINLRRLFDMRNGQWVKEVVVKRGDSASRIASENGSTLASMARLNGGSVERVIVGKKLYVMNHPRFNLVIHRRTRTADLSLNGKFFKRYDLPSEARGKEGAYQMTDRKRQFWKDIGVSFAPTDRNELEMLLPVGASVIISEM